MRKSGIVILSVVIMLITVVGCENKAAKPVEILGDWKFEKYVPGTVELSPQSEAMVNAIVSVFKDCEVSYLENGQVRMSSPVIGRKSGTYTVVDGKLDQQMGKGTQFILHVQNEGGKLVVLLNEDAIESVGKIVLIGVK